MGAAVQEMQEHEERVGGGSPALLRQEVAERLAAHRTRQERNVDLFAGMRTTATAAQVGSRSQRIASAVAERYAQSQSYRAFLAAEAENATRRAQAAAVVATRTAEAVAAAERELLEELQRAEIRPPLVEEVALSNAQEPAEEMQPSVIQVSRAGISVKLFEDAGWVSRNTAAEETGGQTGSASRWEDTEETRALDEEISFRQAPTFELERQGVSIPGNLLEFPRHLVAARKARPRYAEGPLTTEGGQLRIFEVEAEQMTEAVPVESSAPEWSSIWLDALAGTQDEAVEDEAPAVVRPFAASIERRVMAAVVDACLVAVGLVAFATVVGTMVDPLPTSAWAAACCLGALVALFAIYQMLFFTFAETTPGMRYARVGLCTFEDENPTRAAMRLRTLAVMAAGLPLGLGFLWAYLDNDRLGWHDRMSRMYPRSY